MPGRIISSPVQAQSSNTPIHKLLVERCRRFSEKTFLVEFETGNEYTYAKLLDDSLRVASALKELGLIPGDIFMIYGFNCYEYIVAFLGGLCVGGIVLPIRGGDTTSEFQNELESKDVRFLFIDNLMKKAAISVKNGTKQIKDVILLNSSENDSEIKSIRGLLDKSYKPLNDDEFYDPQGNQHSIAILLESSGTTGVTKSAQLAHYDLSTVFDSIDSPIMANLDKQSHILLGSSPIAHLSGLSIMLMTVTKGSILVTITNNTVDKFISAIEKYRVTLVIFSPTTLNQLMKIDRSIDLSSLKTVYIGGTRLPKGLGDEFVQKFNIPELRNCYTMTEITAVSTIGDNEIGNFEAIGKVSAGIKIKVVNTESGVILGENETGEICVKPPFAFKGYYKNEKISKELIDSDGFIKTGDIGYFDEKENFFLIDRIKDIIKQNGFGYSPVDVEEVLLKHEAVNEVAVVGIPDKEAGEISHAFVVLKNNVNKESVDTQQMIDFVNKQVSNLKHLKGSIHLCDKLPKTNFGKILRRKIREEYLKSKNLHEHINNMCN